MPVELEFYCDLGGPYLADVLVWDLENGFIIVARNGELVFNGFRRWRILEVGGRDTCTTMWIYLVPLNCIPESG